MRRLLPILFLSACSSSAAIDEAKSSLTRDTAPTASATDIASAATSARDFGIDLYAQIAPAKQNVFFSPHSIVEALMMTYAGARTQTAQQMHDVLHLTLPDAAENAAMNGLDLQLRSRGEGQAGTNGQPFTLAIANALWGQKGFSFEQPYLDELATDYGAGVNLVDFVGNAEGARSTINEWVATNTANKIQDLLAPGSLDASTTLVLTNAVYFDAAWADPFDASSTAPATFTKADGTTVSPSTMVNTSTDYAYYAATGVQAVSLPYAGNQLAMVLVRPDDLATFDLATLDTIFAGLANSATVTVHLPKFSFTDSTDLAPPLTSLGMRDAFSTADFSGIDGKDDLVIADVVHKAYIAVDEKGTEAAAATAVIIDATAVENPPPAVDVKLDRPFLFVIRDTATGAIVFLGRVVDPTK